MIPSLLQIPSAVSDSKLHSVLPNNGKGDFQFDRSTGATRINKDGLIEEVGYFSSELVQNGNFSELGNEELTNGDFATDSDWTKGTGWVIMNGYAESDGTNAPLDQVSRLTIGKTYKVVITVTNMTSSALSVRLGTSSSNAVLSILENGTYTAYGVAGATTFRLRSQGFDGRIQNVSVKQVDPNDRWTLGDGSGNTKWSITDKANYDHSGTSGTYTNRIVQTGLNIKTGKKYKLTFDVTTTGSTAFWIGNDLGTVNYEGGTYRTFYTGSQTAILEVPNNQTTLAFYNNNSDATLNNISLVEVQGDRPRLSYDITNGVVEDKPHLLLEPSATNLFNFSEDYSQSYWTKSSVTLTSGFLAPDGSLNASKLVANASDSSLRIDLNATSGTTYSLSFYLKTTSGTLDTTIGLGSPAFPQNEGEGGRYKNITVTNEWQRFTLTSTADATANTGISFGGFSGFSTGEEVLIFAAQLETTGYPTSYIPTAGTTITRAAETCNNSKPSVNSTEGVLYCEIQALASDSTAKEITISDGTTNNRVIVSYNTANQIRINYRNSSTNIFDQSNSATITDFHKIAVKWKVNDFSFYLDGSEVASSTSGSVMSANTLTKVNFDDGAGTFDFYGKVKGLAVYNEALSESQLMQLTGVTASSIYSNFVTRTASFTVEALNEVKKVIDNL